MAVHCHVLDANKQTFHSTIIPTYLVALEVCVHGQLCPDQNGSFERKLSRYRSQPSSLHFDNALTTVTVSVFYRGITKCGFDALNLIL